MNSANEIIAVIGAVLLGAVLSSAVTRRIGMPLLLAVLVLGMLLGEDGIVGIRFDDVESAFLIGNVALAVILFDGGMNTDFKSFRVGLRPALSLATIGVLVTTAVTGAVAYLVFDVGWLEAMLVGAIVGSTDAAAVFGVLRPKGLRLKQRVAATLEIESGSNDPMAVFLTIVLVEALSSGQTALGFGVAGPFIIQMGLGAALGLAGGRLLAAIINGVPVDAGLYPLIALAGGLAVFGVTAVVGGSGFLAVYLAGLLLGNRRLKARSGIRRFHDGSAWLAQIGMFLVLGLLVTPSELVEDFVPATVVALGLMLVARPLAVFVSVAPFRFPWREQLYISWVGLRGAVPIILSLFPLLAGVDHASLYFDVAFVVVLISLIAQGWSVAPLARWGKLDLPANPGLLQRVELDIPGRDDLEMVCYRVQPGSSVANRKPTDLGLPEGVQLGFVIRGQDAIQYCDLERLSTGDLVYALAPPAAIEALDQCFSESSTEIQDDLRVFGEFVLDGEVRLNQLRAAYGVELPPAPDDPTVAQLLARRFERPVVGDRIGLGPFELVVREMDPVERSRISKVGLKIRPEHPVGSRTGR